MRTKPATPTASVTRSSSEGAPVSRPETNVANPNATRAVPVIVLSSCARPRAEHQQRDARDRSERDQPAKCALRACAPRSKLSKKPLPVVPREEPLLHHVRREGDTTDGARPKHRR